MTNQKAFAPGKDTLWLVKIAGVLEVIAVSALGDGFFIPGKEDCFNFCEVQEWLTAIEKDETLKPQVDGFIPPADSLWLVVVECRYNVVKVSDCGRCFFIPGQEPCWLLDHVAEWLLQVPQSGLNAAF